MLEKLIQFSLSNKLIVLLFTATVVGFGIFSIFNIPIGAVPDITNNQVQVITTSRNLSTLDVEQFITYPVELEMANLPGVKEIRSVSKFGLSVVTIVFEDNLGTYLPRQLIAEKIKTAAEKIPEGFGTPEMGPITTGLGEIYQYILDTEPGYEDKYSITDLRTIQDWIVKRQLSGIPGVVEINTWGGFLKQYEVALNPKKLRAMDVTVSEVFEALEKNNSVAGGGYIEKQNESYFIRGEGLIGSMEDIDDIVVKTVDGFPVYIKDIAKVQFGHATRFGAITGNGEGEKVLGQVMMLKGADSKKVIDAVIERVDKIQESLPEGIYINGFLERSELIGKTTNTVIENLVLGCLIVIFIVVLLLGNMRSGLVIASVIPLSLFFAISMMYIFNIDANLMSLGAIDFGIIIDGAVIIVEYIAFKITSESNALAKLPPDERKIRIDKITFSSASKMMNSAVFGQLIILIVFIPILSLTNVEGKMFRPMALTFSFALIGAMIFCFTYVPVASAMFLRPSKAGKKNISVRLMAFLNRLYKPSITWSLNHKTIILSLAGLLLIFSVFLYSRMGGEFVPTLDEGDFVIQPVLKTGTSLSKTIEITTRIEQILIENFPEVEQVVSRIGAAEVPTDPMSMEESDVIIKLAPKSEWVSAKTKDGLADKFKESLSVIPGVEYEFTQPIEMRFNELITGVRADIAVKVFGEDMDLLYEIGDKISSLISGIEGASDITLEKTAGLPQMSVKYDRRKIAKYGLNIQDLNRLVQMGFAGSTAGNIFEGEKRFDLVVRLDEDYRKNIGNLQNLYVDLPSGKKVPLDELAEITYTTGPAKISRDDTKRRIVVGVNVRNRDLESVVSDIQTIIDESIELPVGYSIDYGGQFENLRSARNRLKVAVPIALILIFIMLHFAFKSLSDALMVYTAIPLSAVGGVLMLWIRDMPFSISAGVGFIALFGIAVLNGIVLIEHFKELKEEGFDDICERVITGTQQRLRPVLLTASAAALGFLPMAISTSAGAEVQRPLASVVIGGLISSTLLTMIVLPVLYSVFEKRKSLKIKPNKALFVLLLAGFGLLLSKKSVAQEKELTLEQAIEWALQGNNELKSYELRAEQAKSLIPSAFNLEKTMFYYNYDQNNFGENGMVLNAFGVEQNLEFPSVYGLQKKVNKQLFYMEEQNFEIKKRDLMKEVSQRYYTIVYNQNKQQLILYLDSLYRKFAVAADRRFELGETNSLEKLTAQAKQNQLNTLVKQIGDNIEASYQALREVMQVDSVFFIKEETLDPLLLLDEINLESVPGNQYFSNAVRMSQFQVNLDKNKFAPNFKLDYYLATNNGPLPNFYNAFVVGVAIPLWFGGQKANLQSSKIQLEIANREAASYQLILNSKYQQLQSRLNVHKHSVDYYQNTGKELARAIVNTAERSYYSGEINFFQYIQSLDEATNIVLDYLENLNLYNQTILEIKYLNY
jgi:cobalt-zinc-cadmium resistance protein CzcA